MGNDKKIRVCHLISGDLWAGAEVQMFNVMMALTSIPEFELSAVLLNNGTLAEELRREGIRSTILDETRLRFPQILHRLLNYLDQSPIDILHSHRYKENILAAHARKKGKAKRLVQTVHGLGEPIRGFRQVKSCILALANIYYTRKYFDRVITVSDDIHRKLQKFLPREQLVTIHNAIDCDKVTVGRCADDVRAEFGIERKSPLIGSVGRMAPVKGFGLFLKMARQILDQRPDARFLLVGDGPLKAELENDSRRLNLERSVIFTGFRRDATDIINSLDLFVMTSYHEGIPMALLEAMVLGKGVVATAVGGIPEIIEDGISGLLVKSLDANELAVTCLRLMNDSNLCKDMGAAAKSHIETEFSIPILRGKMNLLYKSLLI
jgi:glycosyltransferase involved in cell wall biosynthesis